MITPEKIAEWLKEVEERPSSGSIIIQYIANRLSELTTRNEELLAENIELRSGRKVEEYESRITNLEYQLEILKRQVGGQNLAGEVSLGSESMAAETASLLIYNPRGELLRVEMEVSKLVSGGVIASFRDGEMTPEIPLRLLATSTRQELLFVFDSGRTQTLPVSAIPAADPQSLSWKLSFLQEPRGIEELAFLLPIARMSLFEYAVQASRRGFVKKIKRALLETHVSKDYIGSGTKQSSDRTCAMTFCGSDDLFAMVSREGFVFSIPVERLPFSVEEALRLGMADHIVSAFAVKLTSTTEDKKPFLVVITQNGKVVQRDVDWLEPANSFKSHGQPFFSKERRISGVRAVAAELAGEKDWAIALSSDGRITAYKMADLFGSGTLLAEEESTDILGFTILNQT